ncbi:hypothetical protein MA16_Dca024626 [Dendrobium catenatum]|uniref:Uncharacterized protein n=1 Tax=Dendrobium catenatum TaxID=906689 RepID=A0A2I0VEA0_9ASPA|nr:hypothetical protein MA16_Dca024626 [Dendrobium catenatum]
MTLMPTCFTSRIHDQAIRCPATVLVEQLLRPLTDVELRSAANNMSPRALTLYRAARRLDPDRNPGMLCSRIARYYSVFARYCLAITRNTAL